MTRSVVRCGLDGEWPLAIVDMNLWLCSSMFCLRLFIGFLYVCPTVLDKSSSMCLTTAWKVASCLGPCIVAVYVQLRTEFFHFCSDILSSTSLIISEKNIWTMHIATMLDHFWTSFCSDWVIFLKWDLPPCINNLFPSPKKLALLWISSVTFCGG